MPLTVNGMGTAVVPSSGIVAWTDSIWTRSPDFDGMECMVFFFLPIFPYQAIHTFDWNGNQYRKIPIRWSVKLVVYCYLRRWLILSLVIGAIVLLVEFLSPVTDRKIGDELTGAILLLLPLIGWSALRYFDRRARRIRMVLGRHKLGSSDPATWAETILQTVKSPHEIYGKETFSQAATELLQNGKISGAMWAARFAVAKEDKQKGEKLTDLILDDINVKIALKRIKRKPSSWHEAVQSGRPEWN